MDHTGWVQLVGTASIALFVVSLVAVFYGVRFRIWWLAAVVVQLSLPVCLIAHFFLGLDCLIPFLQLAVAVALRWRVGAAGALALLLMGLIVGLVGDPGTILMHRDYGWVLLFVLLVGFIALAWNRPPWERAGQPRP